MMIQKLILAFFVLGVASADDDPCAPVCETGDDGLYPHPQDCTKFYHCFNGNAVLEDCPGETEFNPSIRVCDFPEHAGCTADPDFDCGQITTTVGVITTVPNTLAPTSSRAPTTSAPPPTTSTSPPSPTTSASPSSPNTITPPHTTTAPPPTSTATQADTTTTGSISTTTAQSSEDPSGCVPHCPSETAIYANPRDCNTYFMCFGGNPFLMTCNPDDEYNPEAETCQEGGSFECTAGPDQPCVAITVAPSESKLR